MNDFVLPAQFIDMSPPDDVVSRSCFASKVSKPKPRTTATRSLIRLFLLVVSNLVSNAVVFGFTFGKAFGDLGAVSRQLDAWWEVGGLVAWRAVELGLAWILDLDARDASSFFTVTNIPTLSLLSIFYKIRPTTILVLYATSVFSPAIPLALLRASTSVHSPDRASAVGSIPNRSILQDGPTSICTTFVASAILSLSMYVSYATWLPTHLVVHFQGILDITALHAGPEILPCLFFVLLVPGWLLHDFLFVGSTGAPSVVSYGVTTADHRNESFAASVYRHTWGALSTKTKVLLVRTVSLAGMLVVNTIVQVAGTVKGVDVEGAAGWGALWGLATLVTGLAYSWIQGVEGV